MPAIPEHDQAVLTVDLPHLGLRAGDVGVVVHVHAGGAAYEVEFCTHAGRTIAIETLTAEQVRPVAAEDVVHARRRAG
jgi:hypothetical protein